MAPRRTQRAKRPERRSERSGAWTRVSDKLLKPVDAAGLTYFRIAFYSVMLWEVWRFIDHDWVRRYFTGKEFYFTYWPFDFLHPLPGDGMTALFYLMGVASIFAAVGLFYRVSASAFFLMIAYVFLLEKARYLNHLYLVCLISFLMPFLPAHRHLSMDAWLRPGVHSSVVPAWSLWLVRFQVGVPMFFGGIAKLNGDWLRGEPLRAWLADRTDFPIIGRFFNDEPMVWVMNYWAIFLDLFIVFFLLHRRTRVFAFLAALQFHFTNSRLFDIGIFPWMMIAATAIFFEPNWPRRLVRDLRAGHPYRIYTLSAGFILGFWVGALLPETVSPVRALIGALGGAIAGYHIDEPFTRSRRDETIGAGPLVNGGRVSLAQRSAIALLGVWVLFQVLAPMRHLVVPGNVHWTEEGHNFSWHMKLRDKDSDGFFVVFDPHTGEEWRVDPSQYLTGRQQRKMTSRPEMIVQFAHFLKDEWEQEGRQGVEVRAFIAASLNGRAAQVFIDPTVDLTGVTFPWFGHANWILPLEKPLRAGDSG